MNASTPLTAEERFLETARDYASAAQILLREEGRTACAPVELLSDNHAVGALVITFDLRIAQGKIGVSEPVRAAVRKLRDWTTLRETLQHTILAEIANE